MARAIERIGEVTLRPRRLSPFQSLVHAIIHQQLSGHAAGSILRRFKSLFGTGGFPGPAEVVGMDVSALRMAGLSGAKASYIRGLALHAVEGCIPSLVDCQSLSDAELVQLLTAVKGIGRWTVEMFLIFNLGRPDVLPVDDLGVRRGYMIAYRKRRLPEPEELRRIGARWAPHRTVAALYLWRTADLLKDGDW